MTQPFGFWPVNHANCALESRSSKRGHRFLVNRAQVAPKAVQSGLMKQFFITAAECRPHNLALRHCAPIRRRGHSAVMGGETDQHCFLPKTLSNELTNV